MHVPADLIRLLDNFLFVDTGFLRDSDSKTGKMIGQTGFLICASAEWGHLGLLVAL